MTAYKDIMKIVPSVQATALAADLAKESKKKQKSMGDLIRMGTKSIVGTELIKIQSDSIASL